MSEETKWISVDEFLPEINISDKWDAENMISKRVVVHIEDFGETFGKYYYNPIHPHWTAEGISGFGQRKLTHWLQLPNLPTL